MLEGCDWKGLLELIERIRKRVTREFGPSVEIISCYEASYDGFWLHRLLEGHGVRNHVIDPASLQVDVAPSTARFRAHARERRVVPISELVFGALTQNRSSLEPSLGFAAIARHAALWIMHVQASEELMRDPQRLWRIRPDVNGCAGRRLPSAKSTAKVPPFSMRGVPGNGGKSKRRLKTPRHNLPRARPRAAAPASFRMCSR
jgi:hypothetical protein